MIKPQDKREGERMQVTLPAVYMDRVKAHGKELNDSSPEYVVSAIVQEYFDEGHDRKHSDPTKEKNERTARTKEKKSRTVSLPAERKKEVA
jgi:hypothetical protein